MQTIPISEIIITNRQRREFKEDKLYDLSTSIQSLGLLQSVVLQDDQRTLVAGERRIRATQLVYDLGIGIKHNGQDVPKGHIPYVTLSQLSDDHLVEAELHENILREDLTWQEETAAIARLHELRCNQNQKQTYTATAKEITSEEDYNVSKGERVKESVLLNEHLDDPQIKAAKSRKEAFKLLKKKKEQELTTQLAANFDISKTPHQLYHGDFRDFKKFIPTSSIDCICTDPPYGIGANDFGDQAGAEHGYEDSVEYFENIIKDFVIEATRVAKPSCHLYAFCDPRGYSFIQQHLEAHGWVVWNTPLIWSKGNGMLPQPEYGPRRTYEFIIFARRGDKKVRAVYPDVIDVRGLSNPKFGAEKPSSLFTNLLSRSVVPGDTIWEPFCGTGPIFAGANKLSVRVIGSELIKEKYEYAKLRLDEKEDSIESLLGG